MSKVERLGHANALIDVISRHGRRFFLSKDGRIARFELDARGRVWWIDDYRGARIYVAYSGRWRGFSHGGTLRRLVEALRDYIQRGDLVHPAYIAPNLLNPENGDVWGYGAEAAAAVRAKAHELGLFARRESTLEGGDAWRLIASFVAQGKQEDAR